MEVAVKVKEDDGLKKEAGLTSAAAFVEGGIQEALDDSCSICLEPFCDSNPSTVTSCKHEFHLQCVLEWCQRSSNCPMCWQSISLKDPDSQELLEAVEQERSLRSNPARNATIFHYPPLGDFELQQLPMGVNDSDLEERIIQHLAAAAAMGRRHHIPRREALRSRTYGRGRPQFLVFPTHPTGPPSVPLSTSLATTGLETESATSPSVPLTTVSGTSEPLSMQSSQLSAASPGSTITSTNPQEISVHKRSAVTQSSVPNQDQAGPSECQTFSDSWRSRFNAMSMKYKESISKSTRGWKDKLFSRSTSMADISSEVRREVNAGIASVSRMMERLETRESNRADRVSASGDPVNPPDTEQRNHNGVHVCRMTPLPENNSPDVAASSNSN